ncbi:histone deacetylase HDT1 isoform X2 [Morus notabilis]|uniref:histone deacetylase HDT1 isoform X2 n=1 Tax=Morus notabilis TaxID=981085 RepID=UPI000CED0182|nr:histone deacetylase HDT1 isoform X2 [Morus notabilis]
MEFWGVEVKAGEPLTVVPDDAFIIHLSQACLGESETKSKEPILLSVKVADKKFVLGTLSLEKIPQLTFDLVFEKEFELTHNWKHGSIYLCGYQTFVGDQEDDDLSGDESEEEEDIPPQAIQNGKGGPKVGLAKPAAAKTNAAKPESTEKPKVKVVEPSKDEDGESDEDSDESDEDDSDDEMDMLGGDSDDAEDKDEEDDEATPKKLELSKKRANDSADKTPVPAKKPKAAASPKSEGKKVVHTATPHPAKKAGKTSATGDKSKDQQTPKSGGKSAGKISCKSCSKTFASDGALDSHTKAKHA